jgi:hypothetical protein
MPKDRAAAVHLIARHAPVLAVHLTEPLVHFLSVGRALCGNDLDAFLILLVVIQQANRHADFAALDPADVIAGRVTEIPSFDVNMQSVADVTGIPKETVRRKTNGLIERGWIVRQNGFLRLTPEGYRAVTPAREAAIQLAASLVTAVGAVA